MLYKIMFFNAIDPLAILATYSSAIPIIVPPVDSKVLVTTPDNSRTYLRVLSIEAICYYSTHQEIVVLAEPLV
jgi:hypothetical protein